MRLVSLVCIALVCTVLAALAQFAGESPADTVRPDSIFAWMDTTAVAPDSSSPPDFLRSWLAPAGALLVTTLGFALLFTTRSK